MDSLTNERFLRIGGWEVSVTPTVLLRVLKSPRLKE